MRTLLSFAVLEYEGPPNSISMAAEVGLFQHV